MGTNLSVEKHAAAESSQPVASVQSNVSRDSSLEWIETINSLVDDHMKVAEQISKLEEELFELKKTYMTKHDEIITIAERIKRSVQESNYTVSGKKSTMNKPDNGAQSAQEANRPTTAEISTNMDELKLDNRQFEDLIQNHEHLLLGIESKVDKQGDTIKEHEKSIKLLKEQHRQRKRNIKIQRVYMKGLKEDFKKYETRIQKIDKEYQKILKRTQKCKPSLPIDRQTTEQKNTGRESKAEDSEKTTHITPCIEDLPVQKKSRMYEFALNEDLTQAFQSLKGEKLGSFNSTAEQNYFNEFLDILKEDVMGVSMHEYSPIEGFSAFDRILVFGTCTLRVESDSNMALAKIPKEHQSKVVLVMFHKTAGSKTPEEVYMYTFKHAEVVGELHVPFKLNS